MTQLENAIVWLYIKTWGKFGDHVIEEKDLWYFSGSDLETVIMSLAFPRKKEKTERVKALTDLIMEKFEQDSMSFYKWAAEIHQEFIETFPEAVETKQSGKNKFSSNIFLFNSCVVFFLLSGASSFGRFRPRYLKLRTGRPNYQTESLDGFPKLAKKH